MKADIIPIMGWILCVGVLVGAVWLYNRLIARRAMMQEGWSGIDVQLKKRADLLPSLVDVVKAYAAHEKALFETITTLRSTLKTMEGKTLDGTDAVAPALMTDRMTARMTERAAVETRLSGAVSGLFAVAEAYPSLKADQNFLALQEALVAVEDDIQHARRYYNATVRDFNIAVLSVPSNIIARLCRMTVAPYFELTRSIERTAPDLGAHLNN